MVFRKLYDAMIIGTAKGTCINTSVALALGTNEPHTIISMRIIRTRVTKWKYPARRNCRNLIANKIKTGGITSPTDLNIAYKNKENLKGKNAEYNAQKVTDIFKGELNEFSDSVALNAAAGLIISDKEKNFKKAFDFSKQHLKSGKVYKHLRKIQSI